MFRVRDHQGFSLAEVLGAVVLLGLGLTAGMTMFQNISRSSVYNQERLVAENLLQMKIEEIKALGYNETYLNTPYADFPDYAFIISESSYDPELEGLALKMIDVTVSWNSGASAETVTFLLAER